MAPGMCGNRFRPVNHRSKTIGDCFRTRFQYTTELPAGVPEHIFHFPEQYGGEQCGIHITEEQLLEVAELSDVFEDNDDYLNPDVCKECERHLPNVDEIEPKDPKDAYLYLKSNVDEDVF